MLPQTAQARAQFPQKHDLRPAVATNGALPNCTACSDPYHGTVKRESDHAAIGTSTQSAQRSKAAKKGAQTKMNQQAAISTFIMSSWKNTMKTPFPMKQQGASFCNSCITYLIIVSLNCFRFQKSKGRTSTRYTQRGLGA